MTAQKRAVAFPERAALGAPLLRSPAVARPRLVSQGKPMFLPEMEEAALDALRNDRFLRGENVTKFEEEFARFIGADFAVSTSSGTNALQFIMIALGLSGQKVVTTPNSFIATANAVLQGGGTPVFGDIDPNSFSLDPDEAEEGLKMGASALLPVHIYGHPANLDAFLELSERYAVPVVEDACQAHGAMYRHKRVGSLGTAAAFSFYPSKNMSVLGDGGMVTTNDKRVAATVAKLRDGGRASWYEHDVLGYSSRLSSVNAAIGRVQLKHLDEWNARRRKIAETYRRRLQDDIDLRLPPKESNGTRQVYHQFVIRTPMRDALRDYLKKNGVETAIHYPLPIHLQPVYVRMYEFAEGAYPKSERFARECLSLPMHPFLSDEDVEYVCQLVSGFRGGAS